MSRKKLPPTKHFFVRAKQRLGWEPEYAAEQARLASRKGLSWGQVDDLDVSYFLSRKESSKDKRAKLYNGAVFVFSKTSSRCYTVYQLPSKEELERYGLGEPGAQSILSMEE